jgi:large subunit ribosomal protein L25
MERVTLTVHPRDEVGSREARRLRRQGLIPAVLYGSGKPAVPVSVDRHALREAITTEAGLHAVLDVVIEGHKRPHVAIVKEYELDKVKHVVTHVDFQEIKLTEPIESNVTITLEGTPVGVKLSGGLLDVAAREVAVSALPTDMPEHLTFNVDALDIGDVAHIRDLLVPDTVAVLDDPDGVLCSVLAPRVVEVAVGEEEAEAALAAEAEPEVVGEREGEAESGE